MMLRALSVGGLVATVLIVGCDDPSGSSYGAMQRAQAHSLAALCDCYAAVGASSEAECLAQHGDDASVDEADCVAAVYADAEAEVEPHVRCVVDVLRDGEACIDAVQACDPEAVGACVLSMEGAVRTCPVVPEEVELVADLCYD